MRYLICILSFLALVGKTSDLAAQEMSDLTTAKAVALAQGKLIILDFGASWCGPCKKMESQLWSNNDFKAYYDRFILVKVDVDYQQDLALKYGAKSLPSVFVITANEDVLIKKVGFNGAKDYLNFFKAFPEDNFNLNKKLFRIQSNKSAPGYLGVAKELGLISYSIKNKAIRVAYLDQSEIYLKKCEAEDKSNSLTDAVEFFRAKNKISKSNFKKGIKIINKLKKKKVFSDKPDYYNYLMALCYKLNEEKGFDSYFAAINSNALKNELNGW